MASFREVIQRAFREQQVLDIAVQPSPEQLQEAFVILQGIIMRSVLQKPQTMITLGRLLLPSSRARQRDFTLFSTRLAIPHNVYVHCSLEAPLTVCMPFNAGDGSRLTITDVAGNFATNPLTLDGNRNRVNGALSQVLNTSGTHIDLFYRRDLAEWRTLTPFNVDSALPFQEEYDDMFVIELAGRLATRYGRALDPVTMQLRDEMKDRFRAQYHRMSSDVEADILFETDYVSYDTTGAVDSASQRVIR